MQYLVNASVTRTDDGWTTARQLPAFLLDSDLQGIVSQDHARRVAHRMLTEAAGDSAEIHAYAFPTR